MSVGAVAAGVGAVATVYSASQAGKGGDAQIGAANDANAISQQQYNQTRADNLPFLLNGTGASNKLARLLGTSSRNASSNPYTLDDFINYTYRNAPEGYDVAGQRQDAQNQYESYLRGSYGTDADVAAKFGFAAREQTPQDDSEYGSLLRKFSQNDLNNDVVYNSGLQFGLDQGTQGINRLAAAGGGLNSGATLKALTKFGNDYGSTKANDAYNRFTNDQTNTYNKLAGAAGAGQAAVNSVSQAGQVNASTIGNNLIGAGNARAAAAVGSGNALTGGASAISNYYQQNQLVNALNNRNNPNTYTPNIYGSEGGVGNGTFVRY